MAKYKATRNFISHIEEVEVSAKFPEGINRHKAIKGKQIEVPKSVTDRCPEFLKKGWLIPVKEK